MMLTCVEFRSFALFFPLHDHFKKLITLFLGRLPLACKVRIALEVFVNLPMDQRFHTVPQQVRCDCRMKGQTGKGPGEADVLDGGFTPSGIESRIIRSPSFLRHIPAKSFNSLAQSHRTLKKLVEKAPSVAQSFGVLSRKI